MRIRLLGEDELRSEINGCVNSRQWWVFILEPVVDQPIMEHIEETFYREEANGDFHVYFPVWLIKSHYMVSIFTAKKSRMSAQDLSGVLSKFSSRKIPAEVLMKQDIVLPMSAPEEERSDENILSDYIDVFLTWLSGEELEIVPMTGKNAAWVSDCACSCGGPQTVFECPRTLSSGKIAWSIDCERRPDKEIHYHAVCNDCRKMTTRKNT